MKNFSKTKDYLVAFLLAHSIWTMRPKIQYCLNLICLHLIDLNCDYLWKNGTTWPDFSLWYLISFAYPPPPLLQQSMPYQNPTQKREEIWGYGCVCAFGISFHKLLLMLETPLALVSFGNSIMLLPLLHNFLFRWYCQIDLTNFCTEFAENIVCRAILCLIFWRK